MWYEEQFCVVMGPRSLSDVDRFVGELNQLGKDGWDIAGAIREGIEDRQLMLMNKQRSITTNEKIDEVIKAVMSRDLHGVNDMCVSVPNPLSDDGRYTYSGAGALRQIVRLVLEES